MAEGLGGAGEIVEPGFKMSGWYNEKTRGPKPPGCWIQMNNTTLLGAVGLV
jgi:hypothetical protein